jgi:hypothetical protein
MKDKTFNEVAEPLINWLWENGLDAATVIVTSDSATMYEANKELYLSHYTTITDPNK